MLEGNTALITGGANGLGAAIASVFAKEGASIGLVDRDQEGLDRLQRLLSKAGVRCVASVCDVTDSAQVERATSEILKSFGKIDILVNNAGGSGSKPLLDIEDIEDSVWDHVIALNLKSAFLFSRRVIPLMRASGFGRIINMSSTLKDGLAGPLNTLNARLPYSTAKCALVGFTSQLAKDLAPFGITVNALAPGLIHADPEARITKKFQSLDDAGRKAMLSVIPAGRPGTGADVANAALFFALPASSYVTGETMLVAGGI